MEHELAIGGTRLSLEVIGDSRWAILFIHGFPLDRSIWRHQALALEGWRRILPDLRGMGRSGAPESGYSMATYATDLAAVLDALQVDKAILCGLSMGGYIAFECLRRWGDRVTGLVLMDTKAEADNPEGKAGRDSMIALARSEGSEAIAAAMLPRLLRPGIHQERPGLPEEVLGMMARTPVAGVIGALEAMRDRPDSRPLLPSLGGLPVLVLVGEDDALTPPAVGRSMAEAIPGAAFQLVPGAGHLPTLEQPEVTTRLLRAFLEGVRRQGV